MRKLVVLGTVVMMTGVANAEFDIDFEDVSKPKKIDDLILCKGNVKVKQNGDGNALSLGAPNSMMRFKTGLDSKNFIVSLDWYWRQGIPCSVFQLTDFNKKKKFLSITAVNRSVGASSYVGKKMKRRDLFKVKPNTWYRFEVEVKGRSYTIRVTDRGADNFDDGDIVFDSVEAERDLKHIQK